MGNTTEKTIRHILDSCSLPLINELGRVETLAEMETRLVMQEVEYQFSNQPNGYFMAYAPLAKNLVNQAVGNWYQRLYISPDDFKLQFDRIGVRYSSFKEYEAARGDKFKGKFYCSIYDANRGQAFYLRNHELADTAIRKALGGNTIADYYEEFENVKQQHRERVLSKIESKKQNGETDFSDLLAEALCISLEENNQTDANEAAN